MAVHKYPFRTSLWLAALALLLLPASCVTQKKKGEVSGLMKFYHNVTGRYNGYYNANLLIEESIEKLNEQHHDNFNQVLDIYPYAEAPNPDAVAKDLDKAIEKVSIVISLHRPGKWTDDAYLSMARAQYLKQDYESAEETLLYLTGEFSPEAMAKKEARRRKRKSSHRKKHTSGRHKKKKKPAKKKSKKKKLSKKEMRERYAQRKKEQAQKKDGAKVKKATANTARKEKKPAISAKQSHTGPFAHKLAYYEARLWLARNYTRRKMYDDAAFVLRRLEQDDRVYDYLKPRIATAKAEMYLKQKRYKEATAALEEAVRRYKKRKDKRRLLYILGQLYQLQGREKDAYQAFATVVRYKPDYDMAFSAKMNMTLNGWLSGKQSADQAIATLEKMLKDRKNKDYRDQIYYTLAKLYLKKGDEDKAIAALAHSIENSSSNQAQAAESALLLADVYFERKEFIKARNYYSRALSSMDKKDERYPRVRKYADNLRDIATNLQTIEMQDSLLRLAALPAAKQRALAIEKLQAQREREAAARAAKEAQAANRAGRRPTFVPGLIKSTFFAYDEAKVKKGKRAFAKTWGDRPLRDNWRRSAALQGAEFADLENEESGSDGFSEEEIAAILKSLPTTPEAQAAAHGKIYQAMFDLGILYRDRLEAPQMSLDMLEQMMRKYPDSTRLEADALYYLFLDAQDLGLHTKQQLYKQQLIKKYPNSKYARALQGTLADLRDKDAKINRYYDETYALFNKGQYKAAHERITKVDQLFGANHPLQAKFSLLSAMLSGALNGRKAYVAALKDVVAKYKNTEEEKKAKEMLRILGENVGGPIGSVGKASGKLKSPFMLEEKRTHYGLILLDADQVVINDAKNAISDFNLQNYRLQKFRVSNIYLGSDVKHPILVIRKMRDKKRAMAYYRALTHDPMVRQKLKNAKIYVISQNNYRKVLRQKSLNGYDEFFREHYIEK